MVFMIKRYRLSPQLNCLGTENDLIFRKFSFQPKAVVGAWTVPGADCAVSEGGNW